MINMINSNSRYSSFFIKGNWSLQTKYFLKYSRFTFSKSFSTFVPLHRPLPSNRRDFSEERDKFFSVDPYTSETEKLCDKFKNDKQGLHDYMETKRAYNNDVAERIKEFHEEELENNQITPEYYNRLIRETEEVRSARLQEINQREHLVRQTNFPDEYNSTEQASNTNMPNELSETNVKDINMEDAYMGDVDMDIDMEDGEQSSSEWDNGDYDSDSAKSKEGVNINVTDNLTSDNNDPRNKGGSGNSGGNSGPTESSGTTNNSNRSAVDFVMEIESCSSIFDQDFTDIM